VHLKIAIIYQKISRDIFVLFILVKKKIVTEKLKI
jgi:hypothetical protein